MHHNYTGILHVCVRIYIDFLSITKNPIATFLKLLSMLVCMMCVEVGARKWAVCSQISEDSFQESVLSFHVLEAGSPLLFLPLGYLLRVDSLSVSTLFSYHTVQFLGLWMYATASASLCGFWRLTSDH